MYEVSEKITRGSVSYAGRNIAAMAQRIYVCGYWHYPGRPDMENPCNNKYSETLWLEGMEIYTFQFKQIGSKVAYYRRLRNMTQDALAEKSNISTSSLGKIERGKYNNNVSMSMLLAIAEGLHVDVAMLLQFDAREKELEWEELASKQKMDKNSNKKDKKV